MMLTGYYIGNDSDQKWKWTGYSNYCKDYSCTTTLVETVILNVTSWSSTTTSNATFADGGRYYFTIPGLF